MNTANKKKNAYLIVAFYTCIITTISVVFFQKKELFINLRNIAPTFLGLLLIMKLLVQFINGYRLNVLLHIERLKLPIRIWLPLSCAGTLQNTILPGKTAIASKAVYLKYKYGLSYKKYLSITLTGMALFACINTLVLTLLFAQLGTQLQLLVYGLLTCLAILTATVMFIRVYCGGSDSRIIVSINSICDILLTPKNLHIVLKVLCGEFALIIFRALTLWTCFLSVGLQGDLFAMVIISALSSFSAIINITPGNIGITESIIIGVSLMFGIPIDIAMPVSIISRITSLLSQALIVLLMGKTLVSDEVLIKN